ncbi:DUF1918 domain-containing protein [Cryptosporangium minutisporangium]|uniref:DUF1918 domain-containing protein n=1 Tax=Cryptosporangium minutisporangium TaxID=113569 RepID=A0ABP6T783_9ACTN
MNAHVGDEIMLRPPGAAHPIRDGEIIEVAGPDGEPPYRVQWDDGRESLLFPGPDAELRHLHHCG